MQAKDIMSTRVVTVETETPVEKIAELLLKFHISAVPVTDSNNSVVGIVSEGDLMRRPEMGTDTRRHSWWLNFLVERTDLADEFVKSHGTKAGDIMTKSVITVNEDTSIEEIAEILEKNQIKRVPVVREGQLVGLVSRANIVQQLACGRKIKIEVPKDDNALRDEIEKLLNTQPWASSRTTAVTVNNGAVELWGFVSSEAETDASRVALEAISGIKSLVDHRGVKTGMQVGAY
jgi:CBS domain-containing protein